MAKRLKGLYRDCEPIDQPPDTYRYANNALLSEQVGSIMSDYGISQINIFNSLGDEFVILGHVSINKGRVVIFSVNTDGTGSKISVLNPDSSIDVKIQNYQLELNFSPNSEIDATYKINKDLEAVVYFTDGINPPRFVNVDSAELVTSGNRYNIFNYIEKVPTIDLTKVNDAGGILGTGAYYFAVRYIDKDGNRTNFTSLSNAIYVIDDDNNDTSSDGAEPNTPTSKSITIEISNIDTFYNEVEIAVIKKEGGTFAPVKLLPKVGIPTNSISYTHTGNESYTEGSLDEILINNTSYQTAKTIEQADGILYMGNLTKAEDIGYQKYANNIKVQAITETIEDFNIDSDPTYTFDPEPTNRYRNPDISFRLKGYQRDEVYAFYISFILNDGSETKAYHIPGRSAEELGEDQIIGDNNLLIDAYGADTPNRIENITSIPSQNNKRFHFINNYNRNWNTGYWENENETYPNSDDWDIWDVSPSGSGYNTTSGENEADSLRDKKVRHHRMPDHQREPIVKGRDAYVLLIKLHDVKIPSDIIDKVKAFKVYYAKPNNSNKRVIDQSFVWRLASSSDSRVTGNNDDHYFSALPLASSNTYNFDHASVTSKGLSSIPFYSMKNKESIGSVTHLQKIYVPTGTSVVSTVNHVNKDYYSFFNFTKESFGIDYYSDPTFLGLVNFGYNTLGSSFISLNAKAFVPHAQNVVELKSKGFQLNGVTINSESQIFLESDHTNDAINWNKDLNIKEFSFIANLMSHKTELYNSFDVQELVWTGFTETNLSKYDPRETLFNSPAGSSQKARGVDKVLLDPSSDNDLVLNITHGGTSETVTVSLLNSDTKEQVAGKIIIAINNNSTLISASPAPPAPLSGTSSIPGYEIPSDPSDPDEIDPGGGEGKPEPTPIPYTAPTFNPGTSTHYYSDASDPFYVTINKNHSNDDLIRYIVTTNNSLTVENTSSPAPDEIDILSTFDPSTVGTVYLKAKVFSSDINENLDSTTNVAAYEFAQITDSVDIYYEARNPGPKVIKVQASRTNYPDLLSSNFKDHAVYLTGGQDTTAVTSTIGGGDIFLSKHSMRISGRILSSNNDDINKALITYVAESRDNIELRNQGTEYYEIYAPKSTPIQVLKIESNEANLESGNQIDFFDNYYGYNIDYRAAQDIKTAIPYEKNQRFEATKFPTRVIRSQEADPSSSSDFFRTFLENDFKDFGYNRGDLVKINKYANNLLLHMERAIMITRGREELSTGDFRAFLGAGNIFAVEPNELLMSEDGTGGLQNKHHSLLTEEGYFFVDQEEGSVYSLNASGLANISDIGMRNEFEKILPWDLKTYSDAFNPYVLDKRYFTITLGYDKEHSRIFFSKKELTPTQYFINLYNAGSIEFSENSFVHKDATVYDSGGNPSIEDITIPYTANQYFKNKDVTLSYVPQLNAWVSYHTYTPQYYFNSISNLYSSGPFNPITNRYQTLFQYNSKEKAILSTDSVEFSGGEEKSPTHSADVQDTLYLNTEDNVFTSMSAVGLNTIFGNYNDIPDKPFQIGFVENRSPAETKTFYSLSLITSVKDKDGVEDKDKTFTNFQLFTALQDSGSQEIIPFQSLANQGNARNVNGTWMINKFRTPNDEWWKRSRFMDKYVEVLLTYYNYDNNFLYLTNSEVGVKKTVR